MRDEVIPIKLLIDKNADFNEPIELMLGKKNAIFSLDPISILPEEREKVIYIKLNAAAMEKIKNRKNLPTWQMNIVGTVKGEIVKQGKRTFQNAKHREITPFFLLKMTR